MAETMDDQFVMSRNARQLVKRGLANVLKRSIIVMADNWRVNLVVDFAGCNLRKLERERI